MNVPTIPIPTCLLQLEPGSPPEAPFLLVGTFLLLGLAAMVFWVWMLVECVTKEPSRGNDKIVWVVILLLMHFIGALLYFFVRRPERMRRQRIASRRTE